MEEFTNQQGLISPTLDIPSTAASTSTKPIYKARLIADYERYGVPPSSSDRIKRYAGVTRHSIRSGGGESNLFDNDGMADSDARLDIGDPIITVVRCAKLAFLAIGQVNAIVTRGKTTRSIVPDLLTSPDVSVKFQVQKLVKILREDDQEMKEDWTTTGEYEIGTFQTLGRLVQCVNPGVLVREGKTFWIFSTGVLMELGASFFSTLSPDDRKSLPELKSSTTFPYRDGMFA